MEGEQKEGLVLVGPVTGPQALPKLSHYPALPLVDQFAGRIYNKWFRRRLSATPCR
jgi:hypothetical protein